MNKSDFILQSCIFGMSAAIIGILALKLYPSDFVNQKEIKKAQILKKESQHLQETYQKLAEKEDIAIPKNISIESVGIKLNVDPGVIKNDEWTLYEDKAAWLSTSSQVGKGNVIIYAHNWKKLFGPLKNATLGDKITVSTDKKNYQYKIKEIRKVLPNDTEAILSENNQLILYTCDGKFDQKRLVVIAVPDENFLSLAK